MSNPSGSGNRRPPRPPPRRRSGAGSSTNNNIALQDHPSSPSPPDVPLPALPSASLAPSTVPSGPPSPLPSLPTTATPTTTTASRDSLADSRHLRSYASSNVIPTHPSFVSNSTCSLEADNNSQNQNQNQNQNQQQDNQQRQQQLHGDSPPKSSDQVESSKWATLEKLLDADAGASAKETRPSFDHGRPGSVSPLEDPFDPHDLHDLHDLHDGHRLMPPPTPDRRGHRRNVNDRTSLSSLSDLIQRARRLQTNLANGRTASKYNSSTLNPLSLAADPSRRRPRRDSAESRSLSNILASFPPTPTRHAASASGTGTARSAPSRRTALSNPPEYPDYNSNPPTGVHRRVCCGLPLWLVILIAVLAFAIVATAVIIPVVLIVPRDNQASLSETDPRCGRGHTCHNGGISVYTAGTCSCVCTGGYSGPTCARAGESGCSSAHADAAAGHQLDGKNVTVGSAIPIVLHQIAPDFGIQLNSSRVLRLLTHAAMSCMTQNSLVSFDGSSGSGTISSSSPSSSSSSANTKRDHIHRLLPSLRLHARAHPPSTHPAPARRAVASDKALQFARTAVLYVLDADDSIEDASDAHDSIQAFFDGNFTTNGGSGEVKPLHLEPGGHNYTVDFNRFQITTAGDKVIGGKIGKR